MNIYARGTPSRSTGTTRCGDKECRVRAFGNESRTDPSLRGPGIANYDFAVFKRTAITERLKLEFRAEAFNIFNRVQFGQPNLQYTTAANSTFGVISSQLNQPRLMQMALRLAF